MMVVFGRDQSKMRNQSLTSRGSNQWKLSNKKWPLINFNMKISTSSLDRAFPLKTKKNSIGSCGLKDFSKKRN